ncbi:NAGLU [Bugula neritina]|uniref:NAGLU n=1 Tax=Bugula neritina TaxID=10212 RepID=A0A7J7JLF8_BUGNE|nr:NAGLU [Bugula neritina]
MVEGKQFYLYQSFLFGLMISLVKVLSLDHFPQLQYIKPSQNLLEQKAAVELLIHRILPGRESEFRIRINSSLGKLDRDSFRLRTLHSGELEITGSSGVAASLGLGVYLKEYGSCQVAWSDSQLNLSSPLPQVSDVLVRSANDRFHYYSNVCTFGYTYVWWSWKRWQREIDWMALNGVNMPLAFVGQEAITQKVFKLLGPFSPWFRMGNLVKWGGPLSQQFIRQQVKLQHRILSSMRAYGMTPVLPSFSGHVPAGLAQLYPKANITKLSLWSHFTSKYSGTYYLSPTDPLYNRIVELFIQKYTEEFGN